MDDVILFHGSRGGIQGDIQPKSRQRCDFGCGFYMGNNELQAKTLVASDADPYFYKLNVRLSELPDERLVCWRVTGVKGGRGHSEEQGAEILG